MTMTTRIGSTSNLKMRSTNAFNGVTLHSLRIRPLSAVILLIFFFLVITVSLASAQQSSSSSSASPSSSSSSSTASATSSSSSAVPSTVSSSSSGTQSSSSAVPLSSSAGSISSSSSASGVSSSTSAAVVSNSTSSSTGVALNTTSSSAGVANFTSSSSTGSTSSSSSSTGAAGVQYWNASNYGVSQVVGVQIVPFAMQCSSAPWSARYAHTVVSSASVLLMTGGISTPDYKNTTTALRDLWTSADLGLTWRMITDNAPFGVRQGATSVLVNQAVLLIGGETLVPNAPADVWSSADVGITWTQITSVPFSARSFHTTTVDITTNTLLLIGGITSFTAGKQRSLNDVYTSLDSGATWTLVNAAAPFPSRYGATSCWRNSVAYVIGGMNTADGVTATPTNDVWASYNNGQDWIRIGDTTLPLGVGPRAFLNSASFAGNIFVVAGATGQDYVQSSGKDVVYGDMWMSSDAGATWTQQETVASFGLRSGAAAVVSGDLLILLGGVSKGRVFNDVFRANLPQGNPNSDNGMVAGILGAAAGIVVIALALRAIIQYIRNQAVRRREKAILELESGGDAGHHEPDHH